VKGIGDRSRFMRCELNQGAWTTRDGACRDPGSGARASISDSGMAEKNVLANVTGFFGLYGLYVFVAGHTFFDYYYGTYGVDPRWLDLGFAEVMVRGFTVLFLWRGIILWLIYIFVIITPISFELTSRFDRKAMLQASIIAMLLCLVPVTYWVAANAGEGLALENKGDKTSLPYVTFSTKTGKFGGRLLLFRAGMVFVHGVASTFPPGQPDTINLHAYRTDEMTDIEITENPK